MSKFCQHCGAQLEENQTCSCSQAQVEAEAASQSQERPTTTSPQDAPGASPAASPVGAAFQKLVPLCKAYLQSPLEATRTAIRQKDLIPAMILLAIQAVITGLLCFSALHNSGIFNFLAYSFDIWSPKLSFVLCLIYGILTAVIAILIFVALIFALSRIMKSTCSFQDVIIACGVNSLFVTALLALALLLFLLSPTIGGILFSGAMVAWVVMSVPTTQAVVSDAEQGKFWLSLIAAVLIALLLGSWVGSKLLPRVYTIADAPAYGEALTTTADIAGLDDLSDSLP